MMCWKIVRILVVFKQKLEKEAYDVMEIATTGKFLDPAQNPTHILVAMKRVSFHHGKKLVQK